MNPPPCFSPAQSLETSLQSAVTVFESLPLHDPKSKHERQSCPLEPGLAKIQPVGICFELTQRQGFIADSQHRGGRFSRSQSFRTAARPKSGLQAELPGEKDLEQGHRGVGLGGDQDGPAGKFPDRPLTQQQYAPDRSAATDGKIWKDQVALGITGIFDGGNHTQVQFAANHELIQVSGSAGGDGKRVGDDSRF